VALTGAPFTKHRFIRKRESKQGNVVSSRLGHYRKTKETKSRSDSLLRDMSRENSDEASSARRRCEWYNIVSHSLDGCGYKSMRKTKEKVGKKQEMGT
jgi:hypothetical protein